jgi:riboflavin kinase/FMN adenylyltransferase
MRVYRSLAEAKGRFGPSALTIGNFDGVHLGHQAVFRETARWAATLGCVASVLTFDPHPAKVVAPSRAPLLLSSIEQRCRWMAECGITQALILPFDEHVAALTPEDFTVRILLSALGTRAVLVGENFRFGHKQAGDTGTLERLGKRHGFLVRAVHGVWLRGKMVSSTAIRSLLLAGEVSAAARMLGRFYSLEGTVVPGRGIGRKQTVPTLNLQTDAQVLPASGVYVTFTEAFDSRSRWASVSNIGRRPTFEGDRLSIETHLLNPLEGEPPQEIRIELTRRLRAEQRFESPAALKEQILRDAARAAVWHRRWGRLIASRASLYTEIQEQS